MAVRSSSAEWNGTLKQGGGTMKLGSGTWEGPYTFASRFESGRGTNPEELIGAAHAGCFSMFLSALLTDAGFPPTRISTTAAVHLGDGPEINADRAFHRGGRAQADGGGVPEARRSRQEGLSRLESPRRTEDHARREAGDIVGHSPSRAPHPLSRASIHFCTSRDCFANLRPPAGRCPGPASAAFDSPPSLRYAGRRSRKSPMGEKLPIQHLATSSNAGPTASCLTSHHQRPLSSRPRSGFRAPGCSILWGRTHPEFPSSQGGRTWTSSS